MPKGVKQLASIREAGSEILRTPGRIRQTHQNRWLVRSQACGALLYVVVLGIKGLVCDCAQCRLGRGLCKHVAAIDMWLSERWASMHARERAVIRRPAMRCPTHSSHRLVRDGHRPTKRKGRVQKYLCRDCGRRFSGLPGLKSRHASAGAIADALSLISKGMSLARAVEELQRHHHTFHQIPVG